jgi:hypothetical protein
LREPISQQGRILIRIKGVEGEIRHRLIISPIQSRELLTDCRRVDIASAVAASSALPQQDGYLLEGGDVMNSHCHSFFGRIYCFTIGLTPAGKTFAKYAFHLHQRYLAMMAEFCE